MLIEFNVKNYRSLKDEQTLSLTQAKGGELVDINTFKSNAPSPAKLLKTVAIYGANASGKTNFLRAVQTMKSIVLESATKWQRGDVLPVNPFLLDVTSAEQSSEFEVVFITGGVRYQYGFAVSSKRVVEEWLLAFPKGRPQRWFTRVWNREMKTYEWDMGNSFSGQKQLWQDATRSNALFLSTAVQLNSEQLQPVYDWFKKTLNILSLEGHHPGFTASLCKNDNERVKILEFLKAADLGIHDLSVETEKMSVKHLPDDMPEELKRQLLEKMKDSDIFNIRTIHKTKHGKAVSFEFDDESDGTQKFFALAGPILDTLKNGYVLFIDELHDNFHPKMVQFLVDVFHNNESNPNNAQLIFTTHETSILSQEIFRRDQIWFCEKDKKQATRLYPLTDFSPRKGRENIEAGYLSGRYGALPYLNTANLR